MIFVSLPSIQDSILAHNKCLLNEWMNSWINHCTSVYSLLKWDKQHLWNMNINGKPSGISVQPAWLRSPLITEYCFGGRHPPGTVEEAKMNQTNSCPHTWNERYKGMDTVPSEFRDHIQLGGRASFILLSVLCPSKSPTLHQGRARDACNNCSVSPIVSYPMTCSYLGANVSWSGCMASSLLHSRFYQGCLEMMHHKPACGISGPENLFVSWVDSNKVATTVSTAAPALSPRAGHFFRDCKGSSSEAVLINRREQGRWKETGWLSRCCFSDFFF